MKGLFSPKRVLFVKLANDLDHEYQSHAGLEQEEGKDEEAAETDQMGDSTDIIALYCTGSGDGCDSGDHGEDTGVSGGRSLYTGGGCLHDMLSAAGCQPEL